MTHFPVGVAITQDDYDDLPVGTTISTSMTDPHTYVRLEDGNWQEVGNSSRLHRASAFGSSYMVRAYPDGYEPTPMTATEYKWRFRNHTLSAAHSHSVRLDAVVHALNEMGAGMDALPLRVGQLLRNTEDIEALPDGSLVQVGSPESFGTFGLHVVRGERMHYLLGGTTRVPARGAVIADLPTGYVPPEVGEDEAAMNAFKVKAYVIGMKLKHAQDWCGTYENIVAPLGITPAAIRPLLAHSDLIGTRVNKEGASQLPVGTVLSWRSDTRDTCTCSWFIRAEHAGNAAGTRRIFSHAAEGATGRPGHFADSMTVAHVPQPEHGDTSIDVLTEVTGLDVVAHWNYLPPGTVISWRASQFYMMHRDQRATQINFRPGREHPIRDRGDYGVDSYGSPEDLRVVSFPAVFSE